MTPYSVIVTEEHAPLIAWANRERELRAREFAAVGSHADHCEVKRQQAIRRRLRGLSRSQAKFWLAEVERQLAVSQ